MTLPPLSRLLGAPARRDGRAIGTVADLSARPGAPEPLVDGVVVHRRGRPDGWAPLRGLTATGADVAGEPGPVPDAVLLGRDVLDAQIVDLAGRRVVRVGDVTLRQDGGRVLASGVETGADSVVRRLGLPRLAARLPTRRLGWGDVHLPDHPGATLTVARAAPIPRRRLRFPTHRLRRRRAAR